MQSIHEEKYKDYKIQVFIDEDPPNPRKEFDNFGHMICFHRRYDLGDKHNLSVEEAKELSKRKDVISLPLFLYDHSGITMKTSPFSCPWDSGQVGFIYVTKEEIRKEFGVKLVTQKTKERVVSILRSEVEEYDQYLTGNVYGYTIVDPYGEEKDSCWGFFGNYNEKFNEFLITDCKQMIDYYVSENQVERAEATSEETG
jgi:hypothetical protein